MEVLDLVEGNTQFTLRPLVCRKPCLSAEVGKEFFRLGELFPYLREKCGAGLAFTDDNTINIGPEFCEQLSTLRVFQYLGAGQDAYFNICLFKFSSGECRETR